METKPFSIAVPTTTVIAGDPTNPYRVCVIRQTVKHNARLTLVGGKLKLGKQTHLECAHDEWCEEAGGKGATLTDVRLWAEKTDEYSDVRTVTLGKATDNACPEELRAVPVTAHYGAPDYIYVGTVNGTPHPLDGEASECFFVDVRDIRVTATEQESLYGAQHDLLLAVYRLYLDGRPVSNVDFADFRALRAELQALGG